MENLEIWFAGGMLAVTCVIAIATTINARDNRKLLKRQLNKDDEDLPNCYTNVYPVTDQPDWKIVDVIVKNRAKEVIDFTGLTSPKGWKFITENQARKCEHSNGKFDPQKAKALLSNYIKVNYEIRENGRVARESIMADETRVRFYCHSTPSKSFLNTLVEKLPSIFESGSNSFDISLHFEFSARKARDVVRPCRIRIDR